MEFGARNSDARWARDAWQRVIVKRHFTPERTESYRAGGYLDLLQAKGVRPLDRRMLVNARTGRLSLLNDRVCWQGAQKGTFAHFVRGRGCPCGGGPQTLKHLFRDCDLEQVRGCRERLLDSMMEADDSGANDQWREATKALRKPGWDIRGSLDGDISECHLCIVHPGVHGVSVRHTTPVCGAVVRSVTALLLAGTRVAAKARADARVEFDTRVGLVRGLGALRGEALAATPREGAAGRAARVEQSGVMVRLSQGSAGAQVAGWCARAVWMRYARGKGRLRAEALDGEVWLASHLRLWRAARCARHRRSGISRQVLYAPRP